MGSLKEKGELLIAQGGGSYSVIAGFLKILWNSSRLLYIYVAKEGNGSLTELCKRKRERTSILFAYGW
jgi:hypothetical protein